MTRPMAARPSSNVVLLPFAQHDLTRAAACESVAGCCPRRQHLDNVLLSPAPHGREHIDQSPPEIRQRVSDGGRPWARQAGPRPAPVRYTLTDLGWTLVDVLSAVRSWAEEHIVEVLAARAATRD